MERIHRKILRYVRKDRFKKLKSYVDKHGVVLRDVRTENDENLLHEACRLGKGYFLRYFLDKGVDPLYQNRKGEVPLHVACQRVVFDALSGMEELVEPLMKKCIASAEVADKQGRKPRDVLRRLHEKVPYFEESPGSVDGRSGLLNWNEEENGRRNEESDDEEKWRRKLAEEMNNEYAEEWGNYENDYVAADMEPDTFDNWARKMNQEHYNKRKASYLNFQEQRAKRKKERDEKAEENRKRLEDLERDHQKYLERAREKEKSNLRKEKQKYAKRVKQFFTAKSDSNLISFSEIPWPESKSIRNPNSEEMKEFLLSDIDIADVALIKKHLKEQQIMWHPDRFAQKCGSRLLEADTEKIMQKVNAISQLLNAYLSEIT